MMIKAHYVVRTSRHGPEGHETRKLAEQAAARLACSNPDIHVYVVEQRYVRWAKRSDAVIVRLDEENTP